MQWIRRVPTVALLTGPSFAAIAAIAATASLATPAAPTTAAHLLCGRPAPLAHLHLRSQTFFSPPFPSPVPRPLPNGPETPVNPNSNPNPSLQACILRGMALIRPPT